MRRKYRIKAVPTNSPDTPYRYYPQFKEPFGLLWWNMGWSFDGDFYYSKTDAEARCELNAKKFVAEEERKLKMKEFKKFTINLGKLP